MPAWKVEPARMNGTQGVVVTARASAAMGRGALQLAADAVTGEFGPGSAFTAMTGTGHASMEETSATGTGRRRAATVWMRISRMVAAMGPALSQGPSGE